MISIQHLSNLWIINGKYDKSMRNMSQCFFIQQKEQTWNQRRQDIEGACDSMQVTAEHKLYKIKFKHLIIIMNFRWISKAFILLIWMTHMHIFMGLSMNNMHFYTWRTHQKNLVRVLCINSNFSSIKIFMIAELWILMICNM